MGGRRVETSFQLTLISLEDWLHEPINKLLLLPSREKLGPEIPAVHEEKFPSNMERNRQEMRGFRDHQSLAFTHLRSTQSSAVKLFWFNISRWRVYSEHAALFTHSKTVVVKLHEFSCFMHLQGSRECASNKYRKGVKRMLQK